MKTTTIITMLCAVSLLTLNSCKKKIYGCMDVTATNTSNAATIDDGSCTYPVPEPENIQIEYFSLTFNPGDYEKDYTSNLPFSFGDILVLEERVTLSSTGDYWFTLPYSVDNISMNFAYEPAFGNIRVFARDNDLNQPYQWPGSRTLDFRIAVIKWDGITPMEDITIEALNE